MRSAAELAAPGSLVSVRVHGISFDAGITSLEKLRTADEKEIESITVNAGCQALMPSLREAIAKIPLPHHEAGIKMLQEAKDASLIKQAFSVLLEGKSVCGMLPSKA